MFSREIQMAEQELNTNVETQEQTQQVELSEIEVKAMNMGWRPIEEFDGPEDEFIDAKEFVRRAPLFDKIEHQSKELKNVRKALEALKTHYTRVQETEYNRALASLKEARKEALSQGDGDRFELIDNEITKVEKQVADIKQVQETPLVQDEVVHPEWQNWNNKNPWYQAVDYMRNYADQVGAKFAAQGMQPSEVLKEVEKAVRKEFPHKFNNPNKDSAPDVESSRQISRSSRKDNIELTEQERKVMNTLVSTGQLTKEKYLADLKKIKGIS